MLEVIEKKTRTPRNLESITKGALALELADRVELKKSLEKSIDAEVAYLQQKAEEAAKIASE